MSKKEDCVGCEYKNGYTRTCPTCGYQWEHGRNGKHSCINKLKEQLQQAHRAGWEQAKREAITVVENHFLPLDDLAYSINAITYKEPTNEH